MPMSSRLKRLKPICIELLLSPSGMKPTLAIDPGFQTGCKVAVLDQTGKFLEYQTPFPTPLLSRTYQADRD